MFSSRVHGSATTNRLTLALERRRKTGAPLADLIESNPTRSGILYDEAVISRALLQPGSFLYEPHPRGLGVARQAIVEYYRERGVTARVESLVLASGTSEAYGYLFRLLADPGDEVLVPVPGYPLLEVLTALDAVRLVPYRHLYRRPGGWALDLERLENTISRRTKAIAVVSPNNPTGAFLKKRELEGITDLCRRFGLALIVDEVFSDYGHGKDETRVQSAAGHQGALTFVLNGFSKIVGLPQLKLAWIHVNGPEDQRNAALERLEFIADAYLSVATPVQLGASLILSQRRMIQAQITSRLEENAGVLEEALRGAPEVEILNREGGWYSVIRLPDGTSDEEVCLRCLEEDGVLVHPGYFYDFPAGSHLVLSLLTPSDVFREGLRKLAVRLRPPGGLQAKAQGGIVGP
ncbi:MAG: pyridoxal phosphate-dependent aminotransferase [Spirochaetia bacterium]|jgi:aspartate/methionine/tyrosine aminotransferase